ncbi:MAG: relaxase/mobilization nuclease domain-containing protein [Solobacterium sp.]|nr:relaxase/mobilization nuclease domain-containing protein [Solobacterium sp.]
MVEDPYLSGRNRKNNHIYFNAVNLDENKKWKNFWFSALALQKLSDQICMEHALSVIEKKTYSERESHLVHYQQTHSIRSQIRGELNIILAKQPQNLDELLKRLEGQGYEVKRGKHIAIKRRGQQRFIRLDSLGAGYTQKELQARIDGTYIPSKETKMNLLLDLKQKIRQGKGVGYQRWAEKYNVKQLAETLLFLQQNNIHSTTELQEKSKNSKSRCDSLLSDIKAREQRLKEIQELKNAIFSYSKTNDTWKAYKASSWNPRFREQHREEIEQHKNATNVFQNLPDKSIPKVKDLNSEYQSILSEKKQLYSAFRKEKENKNKWMIAEKNVEMLLSEEAVSEHKMTIR